MTTLYVKIGCSWCDDVLAYLDQKGIAYDKVVVSGDPAAMQEMIDLSGQSKAPTMNYEKEILADFGVEELVPFLQKHGVV